MSSAKLGLGLIVFLALVVIGFFYISVRRHTPTAAPESVKQQASKESAEFLSPSLTAADPALGPKNAAVTIVEFADFRCPHCAAVNPELKKIAAAFPEQVRLVWKDFPFLPPLNVTWLAHEAARCAEKQNQFWAYHDLLFANQNELNREKLLSFARELRLEEKDFLACLDNGQTKILVSRGFEEGKSLGVDGAPFFFVNGKKWTGEMTAERIGKFISSLPAK